MGGNITVRLWTKEDLARIGKDRELTTIFMNVKSFSQEMLAYYPYHLRHTYVTYWVGEELATFYATDDEMAVWFLRQQYVVLPYSLQEKTTTWRKVETV